jgi:SAM-dependent methyltransferase
MDDSARVPHGSSLPLHMAMLQLMNGYQVTQLLYVTATLGIADHLVEGPKTAEELAEIVGANPDALYRGLRALASLGVFTEDTSRRFALTPLADLLQANHPDSMRALIIFQGEGPYQAWGEMMYTMRTGAPGFDHAYNMPQFEYLAQHTDKYAIFNQAMTENTMRSVTHIVGAYTFPTTGVIVDVGGGHGAFIAAILRANPALRGALFDTPDVVGGALRSLEEMGVADRCTRIAGDFFAPPLPTGDIYTLRQVIHDWDDERSVAILRNCAQAMRPDGKVLVIEAIIPPGNEPSRVKFLDLQMLMMNGGRQRTAEEYRQLYAAAGLSMTQVFATASEFSIVEGVRAE